MFQRKYILPDLSFGLIDDGRLQLLDILGAGAYGTIYRAVDHTAQLNTPSFLAVKVLPLADRWTGRGTYQAREIGYHHYVTAHPNILTLHRVVRDSQYLYIVLDYCPDGDMFRVVSRTRKFARNDALIKHIFLQVIDGVDACHQNGIFHRDLKPENILVSAELQNAYLGDFGLATRTESSTNFGAGSSYYMSPGQYTIGISKQETDTVLSLECLNADGHHTSYSPRRADIWALGVILTNMITGRCPWKRAALDDGCFHNYVRDPTFLRQMLPLSTAADSILRRIFTILPEDSIDLQTLRQVISETDTFYMSEEDLSNASVHVKDAYDSYVPRLREMSGVTLVDDDSSIMESLSAESSMVSLDDDSDDSNKHADDNVPSRSLRYVEEGLRPGEPVAPDSSRNSFRPPAPIEVFTLGSAEGSSPSHATSPVDTTSSSSYYSSESFSGEDSDLPVTPETHAQDPDVVVPELAEGSGIGQAVERVDVVDKTSQAMPGKRLMLRRFIAEQNAMMLA